MPRSSPIAAALVGGLCVVAVVTTAAPSADAEAILVDPVDCAADMELVAQAGQVLLALVSDAAEQRELVALVEAGLMSGFAPVGDFADGVSRSVTSQLATFELPGLFASDEEGGSVQRFRDVIDPLISARRQADTLSPAQVTEIYRDYGNALASFGVTMAFAPVVDVQGGPAIGSRSYSDDPEVVVEYAGAVIDGYLQAGVTPVLKHFPGHGRASSDSHDGAAVTPPLDELGQLDLVPYEALLSDDVGVMVGHLDVPGLTDGMPSSLSPAAIDGLLRGEMGFGGLVISDALGMGAIQQVATPEQAVVLFLRAGGDLALVDLADIDSSRSAVVDAVRSGQLERLRLHQAVNRILQVKGVLAPQCIVPWRHHVQATSRGAVLARFD